MNSFRNLLSILVTAIGLTLAGCGGGSGSAGPAGPITLLNETFSAPNGGASNMTNSWVITPGGPTCTASNTDQDVLGSPPQGNPTYGLVLKCQGTITSRPISLRSINTYVLNTPMTFAVDARVDSTGTFGGNPQPGMTFSLEALNNGFIFAHVALGPTSATFWIGTGNASGTQVTRTYSADALFHRYVFVVDGSGNAEWRRDGALQANASTFPTNTGNVYVKMQAPPSTSTATSKGHFDNVLVTAP